MEKSVLLIGLEKSFMVNAIEKGLEKEGYEVTCIRPDVQKIKDLEDRPGIYILYMGDLNRNYADFFEYLDEAIDRERFMLYLIGKQEEFDLVNEYIPKTKIQEMYLRPLDVKLLARDLDTVIDYSEVDDRLKKKILIVDDDGAMLRMMKTWLSVKYHVYMASSGKIALSFLAENPIDLILLDYEMPVLDGPAVMREIRDNTLLSNIPVIFLTAKDDKESVMKVLQFKPDKYLLKSMPKEKLIASIDEFFDGKSIN